MRLYSTGGKYVASKSNPPKHRSGGRGEQPRLPGTTQPVKEAQGNAEANTPADMSWLTEARYRKAAYLKKKRRENLRILTQAVLLFCAIMAAGTAFLLIRSAVSAQDFRKLYRLMQESEAVSTYSDPAAATTPAMSTPNNQGITIDADPLDAPSDLKTMLPKYESLYRANTDLFGWIRIENTVVDYPVMLCEENNEKYLYANFEGKYRFTGLPFADNRCTPDSDNIVVYAHNIKDGSMFHKLLEYEKESYWKEHPTIMFSDLYADYEYEVMAVFYDRVYAKSENAFKFYQFIDAEDEAGFDYAISRFQEKALYDTGVDAEYGDKLITLTTCAYHVDNGRFVVVARRK